jgi:hypothetical protein
MTYNCHSAARREQFSIKDAEIRSFDGSEANRKIIHNASSMSRTASTNVGYLWKKGDVQRRLSWQVIELSPLLDDMV